MSRASTTVGLLVAAGMLGCIEPSSVSVDLIARPGVTGAVRLDMTFASGTESPWEESFYPRGGGELFVGGVKETVNIVARGRRGPATVTGTAFDALDTIQGAGKIETNLVDGGLRNATLMLDPIGFPISTSASGSISFSSTANARQASAGGLSGAPQLTVTWRVCGTGCETVLRAFDGDGLPLANPDGGHEEFPVADRDSEGADYPTDLDMPAVAMKNNQAIIVSRDKGTHGSGIYGRLFTTAGSVKRVAESKTRLDSSDSTALSTPDVAALDDVDSTYVAIWAHTPAGTSNHHVRGVLLDQNGRPLEDPGIFSVAEVAASTALGDIRPTVAAGPSGDFIVGWTDGGVPKVRLYEKGARPRRNPIDVATIETNLAKSIQVTGVQDRYLVVWQDTVAAPESTDGDGTSIRARRLSLIGEGVEAHEFTVNTVGEGDQTEPAVTARPDGTVVVVWTSDSGSKNSTQEMRGRLFLESGLPLGHEIAINLTEEGDQRSGSAAAVGNQAFVIAFADRVEISGGDSTPAGREQVTGRWLVPDLEPDDGAIGSVCDDTSSCSGKLQCAAVDNAGNRCVSPCTGLGDYCPNGGNCTTNDDRRLCLYPPVIQ